MEHLQVCQMTLEHQSSSSQRKDLKKCLRMVLLIFPKRGGSSSSLYFGVHTSRAKYKMNHSETWSPCLLLMVKFHQNLVQK